MELNNVFMISKKGRLVYVTLRPVMGECGFCMYGRVGGMVPVYKLLQHQTKEMRYCDKLPASKWCGCQVEISGKG